MEAIFCQSCGMPLRIPEDFGTNRSGEPNKEYCGFCYRNGDFAARISMDEMILHCVDFLDEWNADNGLNLTKEEAITLMKEHFPKFKRWANKKATEDEYNLLS
ncbi:MAG TPA: zinc ribbon domain-containing protein [Dysgonamonadaceae bacterium]|jgi:hypothetical protein|nr:zinc ribbon domain-containing protein [Dysgonamonadaceae bacterium]